MRERGAGGFGVGCGQPVKGPYANLQVLCNIFSSKVIDDLTSGVQVMGDGYCASSAWNSRG